MPPWRSEVESKMASSILDKKLSESVTKQGVLYIIIMINAVQINWRKLLHLWENYNCIILQSYYFLKIGFCWSCNQKCT